MYSVEQFSSRVKERLQEVVYTGEEVFDRILAPVTHNSGKLIRPRLVYLVKQLFGEVDDETIDVAVSLEAIHLASLVHDDVVDDSRLRRGKPSANDLFGTKTAVLVGDHLFATSFALLTRRFRFDVLDEVTRAIRCMCQGEILQDMNLFNPDLTNEGYYANINGKTASLFAAACRSGALIAGATPQQVNQIGSYGQYLGYAYQIADDISDFLGDERALGKPVGSDLRNGVITLPVIEAMEAPQCKNAIRRMIIRKKFSEEEIAQAISLIHESGGFVRAVEAALESAGRAWRTLLAFEDSPQREKLMTLCEELIVLPPLMLGTGPVPTTEAVLNNAYVE